MIFAHTLDLVMSGRKTQTRRVVKRPDELPRWQVGKTYAVQPGRSKRAVARFKALEVRRELVTDISEEDAHAEGFSGRADFLAAWRKMHGDKASDVWAITFELEQAGAA